MAILRLLFLPGLELF